MREPNPYNEWFCARWDYVVLAGYKFVRYEHREFRVYIPGIVIWYLLFKGVQWSLLEPKPGIGICYRKYYSGYSNCFNQCFNQYVWR